MLLTGFMLVMVSCSPTRYVEKIIGILFLVPSSMLSTISALASQNIGAGKHDRARLTLRYVLCMTVGYGLVAATIGAAAIGSLS